MNLEEDGKSKWDRFDLRQKSNEK